MGVGGRGLGWAAGVTGGELGTGEGERNLTSIKMKACTTEDRGRKKGEEEGLGIEFAECR